MEIPLNFSIQKIILFVKISNIFIKTEEQIFRKIKIFNNNI
jgi:hypothetical protein